MADRLELHEKLMSVLGSNHVYYQPPETIKMVYPCIVYQLSRDRVIHADNRRYMTRLLYTITIIDRNPDSDIPNRLLNAFDYCTRSRVYTASNLNHFVFDLYF